MAELLFVLVTVYVVYVVHNVVSDKSTKKPEAPVKKTAVTETAVKTKIVVKPIAKKAVAIKPKAKTNVKKTVASGLVRDPKTGEQAKIASSYRMTKRWIKEALVTEKLLDKVYKTNEIDAAAKVKITKALNKLSRMKKYQ